MNNHKIFGVFFGSYRPFGSAAGKNVSVSSGKEAGSGSHHVRNSSLLSLFLSLAPNPKGELRNSHRDLPSSSHHLLLLSVQGSAKRSADFVKQQPGRVREKS